MQRSNYNGWRSLCLPHVLFYAFVIIIILFLLILTITVAKSKSYVARSSAVRSAFNDIIGFPALHSSKHDPYVQWTFLHLNDVYELLPLDRGRRGGLARVAYIRKLLKEENPHTYTILAGDLLSPSALSSSKVNGSALNGKQMIATMNTLGLDLMTFGNHEFDLSEADLIARMNESTFTWISTNVFRKDSNELFGPSISHKIITIDSVRVLFIGLTIDKNQPYVRVINRTSLINYVQQYLDKFPNGTYDILVAITHLNVEMDMKLAEQIPRIDLILGGHEHENQYYIRGYQQTPIYKADANAFTVYILRCSYNRRTRQFHIYPTLSPVTSAIPEEEQTAQVANYWFKLGVEGYRATGFELHEVVSCLPSGVELDGRSESIQASSTLLTDLMCQAMIKSTEFTQTTIGFLKIGTIRIDDVLRGTITQYDILRTLPFANYVQSISISGQVLARILTDNLSKQRKGSLLAYIGVETPDNGRTWLVNGTDISISNQNYRIATTDYTQKRLALNSTDMTVLAKTNLLLSTSFMDFLRIKYPPC
ncbi:unnamed protein product [Adineta ricciae]|uniref:5'-nucleotidase n=1 Tax=Adineta ricciae TaxID=249248 RepID=A0A813U032_ADIRI|nr:unnamed protein product [Adineta ricciae]